MAGIPRAAAPAVNKRVNTMRPPPRPSSSLAKASNSRASSAMPPPSRSRAASPTGSVVSVATSTTGTKRKDRDFEQDGGGETNINVVVRCRGRNEREVRENSGVVLSTEGVKGKNLDLSMGPSALSNKSYHFDKVFSAAADQAMIFDDVVTPILDEVILILFFSCGSSDQFRCLRDIIVRYSHMARLVPEKRILCLET